MVFELEINREYELSNNNVISIEPSTKNQIVLCDSHRRGMLHYYYWQNRMNGKYKNTTHFTVDKKGNIYQHYSSYYTPSILGNRYIDSKSIFITLVNEGWLFEDEDGNFKNWVGDLYTGERFECKWRGKKYWAKYSEEQLHSLIELCSYLSIEHDITKKAMKSNTIHNYVDAFDGIAYKSNYDDMYTDINPSWFFKDFKNNIEKKQEHEA